MKNMYKTKYRKSAARLFVVLAGRQETGFTCQICNDACGCTGGRRVDGKITPFYGRVQFMVNHVLDEHPEMVQNLINAAIEMSEAQRPKQTAHATWYPQPGDTGYDLMC